MHDQKRQVSELSSTALLECVSEVKSLNEVKVIQRAESQSGPTQNQVLENYINCTKKMKEEHASPTNIRPEI